MWQSRPSGPRTMKSKYESKCTSCGCKIVLDADIVWTPGVGAKHATPGQCAEAKKLHLAELEKKEASAPTLPYGKEAVHPIMDFLRAAQARGLKNPKLRILAPSHLQQPDGKKEIKLSITKTGQAPGSLAVVVGGEYVGVIRPDGKLSFKLAGDKALQDYLVLIAQNPAGAAKQYAAIVGLCCFCGKELTDEGSTEVGYGPVCAKHWGLPHKSLGTAKLNEPEILTRGGFLPESKTEVR